MNLAHGKFFRQDYSGQDLRKVPMNHSEFVCCNFDKADLTGVDASHSVFAGGSMRKTKCTRTNFMNSQLNTRFEPSDCLGMTLTLDCNTFKGMAISQVWWYGWLYFAYQMDPVMKNGEVSPREALVALIGKERFERLDYLFKKRQL